MCCSSVISGSLILEMACHWAQCRRNIRYARAIKRRMRQARTDGTFLGVFELSVQGLIELKTPHHCQDAVCNAFLGQCRHMELAQNNYRSYLHRKVSCSNKHCEALVKNGKKNVTRVLLGRTFGHRNVRSATKSGDADVDQSMQMPATA